MKILTRIAEALERIANALDRITGHAVYKAPSQPMMPGNHVQRCLVCHRWHSGNAGCPTTEVT